MRVLHVATVDWVAEDGIARAAAAVAARTGAEAHLVAGRPAGAARAAFDETHLVAAPAGRLPWTARFASLVSRLRPDVVHVHGGLLAPAVAAAPALRGIPVVASVYHAPELPTGSSGLAFLRRLGDQRTSSVGTARTVAMALGGVRTGRALLRNGRLSAVCTPIGPLARALDGAGGRVEVVRGAACVDDSARATWSGEPQIVFAGKAERARGVDVLVDAFLRLERVLPTARLRLCLLNGSEAARALAVADRHERMHVTVGPMVDIRAELLASQVAAYPFRWSATMTPPLAAAEAMAAGLPLVGTDAPCIAELVGDRRGAVVVPRDDVDQLAAALLGVLTDRQRWERLAAGALGTIATRWCWDAAARQIDDVYAGVLGRPLTRTEELR